MKTLVIAFWIEFAKDEESDKFALSHEAVDLLLKSNHINLALFTKESFFEDNHFLPYSQCEVIEETVLKQIFSSKMSDNTLLIMSEDLKEPFLKKIEDCVEDAKDDESGEPVTVNFFVQDSKNFSKSKSKFEICCIEKNKKSGNYSLKTVFNTQFILQRNSN